MVDDRCALYSTSPERAIVGLARVMQIEVAKPHVFWCQAQERAAVRLDEYRAYFKGARQAVGLCLADVVRLGEPLTLDELRRSWRGFRPPQGFSYLDSAQAADVAGRLRSVPSVP